MYLRFVLNTSAFKIKLLCVCIETYLYFKPNAKEFFNDLQNTLFKYVKIYTLFFLFYFFSYLCGASFRRDVCNNRNTLNKKY